MRSVFLFLFATLAVGDQATFQAGLQFLQQRVSQLEFNGKTKHDGMAAANKLFVDNLLARVAADPTPMNKTRIDEVFGEVITLLDKIIEHLVNSTVLQQNSLDDFLTTWDNCINLTTRGELQDQYTLMTTTNRTDHYTCRVTLKNKTDVEREKCHEFASFLQTLAHGTILVGDWCEPSKPETMTFPPDMIPADDINDWSGYVDTGFTTYSTQQTSYTEYRTACKNAQDALGEQESACKTEFSDLHDQACEICQLLERLCNTETQCYTDTQADYDSYFSETSAETGRRIEHMKTIKLIQCMLQKGIDNAAADWNFTQFVNDCDAGLADLNVSTITTVHSGNENGTLGDTTACLIHQQTAGAGQYDYIYPMANPPSDLQNDWYVMMFIDGVDVDLQGWTTLTGVERGRANCDAVHDCNWLA